MKRQLLLSVLFSVAAAIGCSANGASTKPSTADDLPLCEEDEIHPAHAEPMVSGGIRRSKKLVLSYRKLKYDEVEKCRVRDNNVDATVEIPKNSLKQ